MYSKVVCGPRKGAFANWETTQMYRLQKPTRNISQIKKGVPFKYKKGIKWNNFPR